VRAGRPTLLAFALAGCLAALPVHAEFQDDYALGLKAIDEGRLREARRYLEKALAVQAEPVDKVILNGNITQPYLPYHFLGVVAYKLGECDAAKAQWENPTNRRMIGRLNQIRQQEQRLVESCKPRQAEVAKPELPPTPAAAPAAEPPSVAPSPATATANAPAEKTGKKPPADARDRATSRPVDAGKATETAAALERVPPPRLVRAVDNYLAGRYVEAARIEPESFPAAHTRFHAFLVRAAARYTLAQINGDKELLAAARNDAHAARLLDDKTTPDEALFSPKFRAFYAAAH
jgi:type IV secretory pathway VirB10-like protein